jgi:DNA-directed RNA polymerase subunit omega
MKRDYSQKTFTNIIYKTEELIDASSNRYKITLQVANRAKRRHYEDVEVVEELRMKPVIRAILEMSDEINQPEIIND